MAAVMSDVDRAEVIDDLMEAYRYRERLLENHQLAPLRGIDSHRFPDELATCDRQIRLLEEMLA